MQQCGEAKWCTTGSCDSVKNDIGIRKLNLAKYSSWTIMSKLICEGPKVSSFMILHPLHSKVYLHLNGKKTTKYLCKKKMAFLNDFNSAIQTRKQPICWIILLWDLWKCMTQWVSWVWVVQTSGMPSFSWRWYLHLQHYLSCGMVLLKLNVGFPQGPVLGPL